MTKWRDSFHSSLPMEWRPMSPASRAAASLASGGGRGLESTEKSQTALAWGLDDERGSDGPRPHGFFAWLPKQQLKSRVVEIERLAQY